MTSLLHLRRLPSPPLLRGAEQGGSVSSFFSYLVTLLLIVSAFVTSNAFAIAPEGSWWNTSYNYRHRIDIPAGTSALASGYALSFTFDHQTQVNASRSLASGNDVRIAYWNGTAWTELDRILDPTTTWNSATTKIWFKTQAQINANATNDNYYIYYGNSGAGAPPATAANVYTLYDEFNGNALDTTLWSSQGPSPVIVSGGILSCPNSCQLASNATFGVDTIWEARVSLSSTSGSTFYYWLASDAGNYNGVYVGMYLTGSGNHTGASDNGGTTTTRTVTASTANTYRTVAFTREGTTTVRFYVNGTQQGTNVTTNVAQGNLPVLVRNTAGPGATQNYDWVRVRPYRTNEPALAMAGREQYTVIAEYRLNETTWNGTSGEVLDSSANGINAQSINGAVTANATPAVAGNPGTCRYGVFDGTNDYVQAPDNALLDIGAALTVSAWIYPRSYGSELKSVVSKDTNYEFHIDNNGEVYWWWNDASGNTRSFTSGTAVPLNQWSHIAITYRSGSQRIYINGVLRASQTYTGALITNAYALQIGYDGASSAQPGRYWNGYIDEVNIYATALSQTQVTALMNATHPCSGSAPHFLIAHDGYGINCAAEAITVSVRDVSNNAYTGYSQQISLDTGSGKGDWTLLSGNGTLANGTANDGVATYTWSALDTSAQFSLSYKEGASPININAYQVSDTTIRDDDTEGLMYWSPNGFTVTATALSNPPPGTIPSFPTPQTAGTNMAVHITAYGTTPTDTQCGVIEAYTGDKSLKFWTTYVNPATPLTNVSITEDLPASTVNAATSEALASLQTIRFSNGQAAVTAKYKDVGLIAINVKDDVTAGVTNNIRGSTGNFVSKPANILLGAITTPGGTAAPTATDQNSARFVAAGQPFLAVVTARDAENSATPNFGKESTPESIGLISTLISPTGAGTNNPAVTQYATQSFSSGSVTGQFAWPEVGIISLAPHIQDGDYLGSGDVSGNTVNSVGRFYADHFDMTSNTPALQAGCGASTYYGEPFRYSTAPVVTITAKANGGSTTLNYTGNYFKLSASSVTGTYSSSVGLDTSAVPSPSVTVTDLGPGSPGQATALFTLGSVAGQGLAYSRASTPVVPNSTPPRILLGVTVLDSDGAASTASHSVGGATGFTFATSTELRYGRIAFRNAVGSELLNLPLPLHAEYFLNNTMGFIQNSADSCTIGVTLQFSAFGGNLGSGETCVLNGSPALAGVGCATIAPVAEQFRMPPAAGDFVLNLKAPGQGNDGTVTVTTVVPAWLRFDWDAVPATQESPSGIATFGIFKGEAKRIFQREK